MHTSNCAAAALLGLVLSTGAGVAAAQAVAVMSALSPVAALSTDQVVDIFLGKTSRFPDGSAAVPVDQPEGSAVRDEFYATYAGKSPAQVKAHWSKIIFTGRGQPPRELPGGADVKKYVAAHPGAIGYILQNQVDSSVRVLRTR